MSARRRVLAGLLGCALALAGCKKKRQVVEPEPPLTRLTADPPPSALPAIEPAPVVRRPAANGGGRRVGDHVSVSWKGSCYAARILAVTAPGTYLITYDGYDHSWDETIGESRICAGGAPPASSPPDGQGRRAGDRVRVRWKGDCYAARIVSVPRPGSYFITYEGYDHSWDETVGESRICK